MKRMLIVLFTLCLGVIFVLPAAGINGFVGGMRWQNAPRRELNITISTITRANLAWMVNADQSVVTLGFTVQVPSVAAGDPVGAVLMTATGEIGRWQEGVGVVIQDSVNYSLRGAAWFPDEDAANHFTFELELGCRNPAAFAALQGMRLQLIDPSGGLSNTISFPIVVEAPVITTLPTTTTVTTAPPVTPQVSATTTTRAPTTAMTWAPTTTATVATTTMMTTRTTVTWSFATRPPATQAPRTQLPATTTTQSTAITQTFATGPGSTVAQAVAATQSPGRTTSPRRATDSPWTFAQYTPRSFETVPLPVETMATHAVAPAQAPMMVQTPEPLPAARNNSLLYAAGALLILFALVLVAYWLLAWRREKSSSHKSL